MDRPLPAEPIRPVARPNGGPWIVPGPGSIKFDPAWPV